VSAERRIRWGYHELSDLWATRLVRGAGIAPGDLVVDVGAGEGALTVQLVAAGAKVIAVELHPGRARRLRQRFGAGVIVVQVDATDLRLPKRPFRVVANPPFGITSALLRRLLSPGSRMVSADLVVPASTAARWAGGRGHEATRWSGIYQARVVTRLPPSAFRPPPPMMTAVLRLERLKCFERFELARPGR
jgi:23S rRNA (adenine-N6)-dimethyltransferase